MPESPILLPVSQFRRSPPATQKIKRGGTGKISNSGNAPKRFHNAVRAIRNVTGQHVPWPTRSKLVWDPTDPFIVAYRAAHPRVEAAWRTGRKLWYEPVPFDIETRDGTETFA